MQEDYTIWLVELEIQEEENITYVELKDTDTQLDVMLMRLEEADLKEQVDAKAKSDA